MARFESTKVTLGNAEEKIIALTAGRDDHVVGMVFSDQSGTLNIEQSMDGTNWDVNTSYPITGGAGKGFSEPIVAPHVRIRYTNGATPQTVFRLSARLSSSGDS